MKVTSLGRIQLFATSWIAAYQAPLSMGFSMQEYWIGVPLPSPNMQSLSKFQGMFHKTEEKKFYNSYKTLVVVQLSGHV